MGRQTPSGLRFFFDVCFPATLARALGQLDVENEYLTLTGEMAGATPDVEWIAGLDRGRIVVSGDGRILKNPLARRAWETSELRGFFLADTFPNVGLWEQTKFVVDRWERLLYAAARCHQGDTHRLPWGKGLKIEVWDRSARIWR